MNRQFTIAADMDMHEELDQYYLEKSEPNRGCLLALRKIIMDHDIDVSETRKYGMPCFCYKKKMFCYLWVDKNTNEPYILMVEGKLINHPDLEKGTRKRMKILRINPNTDLPMNVINSILNQALNLYKKGTISVNN